MSERAIIQVVGIVLLLAGLVLFVRDQWGGGSDRSASANFWKIEASGPPGLILVIVGVVVFLVPTLLPLFTDDGGAVEAAGETPGRSSTPPSAPETAATPPPPTPRTATPESEPTPTARPTTQPLLVRVNFQSRTAPIPDGYVADWGQPFGARTSPGQGEGLEYGWVDPESGEPLDLVAHGRDRDTDGVPQREDTLMHMAGFNPGSGAVEPGAWELAVPDGRYNVTVGVGDRAGNSRHTVAVEGVPVITGFEETEQMRYESNTVEVDVRDGRITVTSPRETNTKITFVEIAAVG